MSILIKPTTTFPISVVIGVSNTNPVKHYCKLKESVMAPWPADLKLFEHTFEFRQADFKTNSEIVDGSIDWVDGKVKVNGASMRYQRLLKTLVRWTLVDDDSKPIPVTEESIGCLPSAVAQVLGDELDRYQEGI
jgi:hypothetical protein